MIFYRKQPFPLSDRGEKVSSAMKRNRQPVEKKRSETDATYNHVLKYTGVFGGVQGLTMLMSIVRNKLAVLLLGTAGFGLISIYNSIATFVSSTSNLGIPFSAVRHVAELFEKGSEEEIKAYVCVVRTWSLWIALLGVAVCLLFSPFISYFSFDGDWSYAGRICWLSPMIFALAVTGGEISILKGVRRLKRVAFISAAGAVSTLIFTVPFFYRWGSEGIIPALVASTVVLMGIHLYFSVRVYPWQVALFSSDVFREGMAMVRLGVAYVLAAIAGSLSALAIPALLLKFGSFDDVGLYRGGYGLMVTYGGMVFVAVEADYFPRLSSVNDDAVRLNKVINQQIEVCLLLMSPFLIVFMLLMPLVVRLLYSSDFLVVVDMAVCATFYMFFRALSVPVAYTALAKGDSLTYLLMEVIYDIVVVGLIAWGYLTWGLVGTGVALSLAGLFDWGLIGVSYHYKYGFRLSEMALRLALSQFVCVAVALGACLYAGWAVKCVLGGAALLFSLWLSFGVLKREATLPGGWKEKFFRKR